MQMIRRVCIALILIVALSFPMGAAGKEVRFAIAANATASDSARGFIAGALKFAEEQGWKVTIVSAEGSFKRHNENIETLVDAGVDFIGVIGGDSRALEPAIRYAHSRGVKCIGIDSGLSGPGVITNVTSDNVEIGREITRFMVERLGGKGNIVVFEEPGYWACRLRVEGRDEVLKGYPGIKIVAKYATEYPGGTSQALAAMETTLISRPTGTIQAVWCDTDLSAVGAARAIMHAKRGSEMFVTGVDGDQLTVMEYIIPNTCLVASVAQDFYGIGAATAKAINEYINGRRDFPENVYVPTVLVTNKNAQEHARSMWPNLFK